MGSSGIPPVMDIRRAVDADGPGVADVWLRSFRAALPHVEMAHTDDEVRRWLGESVLPRGTTWVVGAAESIMGMMVLESTELEQLYVAPECQGRGIGGRFVALAQHLSPAGLALWTFQANHRARVFYERRGFVETDRTDGRGNEEREPDVRYVWRGSGAGDCPEILGSVGAVRRPG